MLIRMSVGLTIFTMFVVSAVTHGDEGMESLFNFIDIPSILIVWGVTFSGTIWSFPFSVIKQSFGDAFSDSVLEEERAVQGYEMFMRISAYSIASGILGNLIGLVKMLANLDDPTAIGPAMAVALLTLFYGVILSEFVFKSTANSFLTRTESKILRLNRGFTTIYFVAFTLFTTITTFFIMMLAFAEF